MAYGSDQAVDESDPFASNLRTCKEEVFDLEQPHATSNVPALSIEPQRPCSDLRVFQSGSGRFFSPSQPSSRRFSELDHCGKELAKRRCHSVQYHIVGQCLNS